MRTLPHTTSRIAAPGTAQLSQDLQQVLEQERRAASRRRAMLLAWVDEDERFLNYGADGQPPRTAQIRQWWRDQGEPSLGG